MENLSLKISETTLNKKLNHPFKSDKLPAQLLMDIKKLSGVRPGPFLFQLALAWAVIIGAITIATKVDLWWVTAIAITIIAGRQVVFGLLVHDQAHKLGLRGPKGDIFTNIFAAYPLMGFSVENYAKIHLAHHKYYFSDKDPDYIRKSGKEWQTPMSKRELAGWFLRDLMGLSTLKLIASKRPKTKFSEFERSVPTPKWIKPVCYLALAIGLTYFKLWPVFLLYWVLPMLTIFPLLVRWGALTEHIYETQGLTIEENSPFIIPNWFDRLIFPNINFTFHPYHHRYPAVAFSELPKVHELYKSYGLIDESKIFHGYLSYLRYIVSKK